MTGNIFYVYEHWRLDRDECFYVGKGSGTRAYSVKYRNRHHKAIIAKLGRIGSAMEVRIVASGLSEVDAFAIEIERIKFWRESGCDLTNIADGGTGISGYKWQKESREKLSQSQRGRPAHNKGKKSSPETIEKIKAANAIRWADPEERRKASERQKGKTPSKGKIRSPETCAKISAAHKERYKDPAEREKAARGRKGKAPPNKGKEMSYAQREKLKQAWERRKARGWEFSEESRKVLSEKATAQWARQKGS